MMKMKKFLMLLTVAAIALMCFTGCGSAKITGITLDDITLEKGESVTLNAEFVADKADIDAETLNKAIEKLGVTFTVADESIAALDGTTLIDHAGGRGQGGGAGRTLYLYGHPDRKHGGHRRLFQ